MKNKYFHFSTKQIILGCMGLIFSLSACTKLDVEVKSEYIEENFPTTPEQYIAATGPAYVQLRDQMAKSYWFLQELTTDEAILPARGANWYDGGTYQQLQLHTWNPQHGFVTATWNWGFGGITTCNRIIKVLKNAPEDPAKVRLLAEMRALRVLYYFMMMDLYGNIPLVPDFGSTELPATSSREAVFAYIEQEIKAIQPDLSQDVSVATYGRPTQWMIQALLAKLYLNAEVYVGKKMYTEAIAACNTLIKSNKFSLTANYMDIFGIKNGPQISEIVFAVPYDGNLAPGQIFARYALHPSLQAKYGIPFRPSNATCTWPTFYDLYSEPTDIRKQQWLEGIQYENDGRTPITISTTKKGLDASYTGTDGATPVKYTLSFSRDLTFVSEQFDLGGDELGKAKGIRNIKYYPDNTSPTREQSNDFVFFRYADILLMKAEALLRGGIDTELNQNATSLTNQIRSRANVPAFGNVTLDDLYQERSREMAWEGWRRNDQIRFGKWESQWGIKVNDETYRRLFPVPTTEISLNKKLTQNKGY